MDKKDQLWIGKIVTYAALILAFILFFSGWSAIGGMSSSDVKQLKSTINSTTDSYKEMLGDSDTLETMQDQLDDSDIKMDAKDYIKKSIAFYHAFYDLKFSPLEMQAVSSYLGNSMSMYAAGDEEASSSAAALHAWAVILLILNVFIIAAFAAALVLIFLNKKAGPLPFSAGIILLFIFFLIINGLVQTASNAGTQDGEIRITAAAVMALIFAILSSVAWLWTNGEAANEHLPVPGIIHRIAGSRAQGAPVSGSTPQENMTICPVCGTMLHANARFCPKCGTKIEAPAGQTASFCPVCGSQLSTGAKFCPKCGTKTDGN